MKKQILIAIILSFLFNLSLQSQNITINKIEPPNWWIGMKWNYVQLMFYGENLNDIDVRSEISALKILKIHSTENNSYAFVDVRISDDAEADEYKLIITKDEQTVSVKYPFLKRESSVGKHQGFSNSDAIYLIFPDRFVNGDNSNDFLFNEKEEFDFGDLNGRHGGDIQGIINKLDYIKELGFTTIWSTPLLENNMYMSYHGYAATDLYKIDPRQGTNNLYKLFVGEAHSKGLKIILDHVANHVGINHEWSYNLPTSDWYNGTIENHQSTYHNKMAMFDIHSDSTMIINAQQGWFTDYMPDMNQRNPFVANYIIQNTIWWIEYSGIDGIREDTYPYNDMVFMRKWAEAVLEEYPHFNILGEVWKGDPVVLASYQGKSLLPNTIETNLPAVTDFAFRDAVVAYLEGKSGLQKFYEVLAQDQIYSNPDNLVVFLDNHDIERAMYLAGGNIKKYKIALTLALTTRGIPKIFYGSEIGLDGGGHHGRIREPFPGGFLNDDKNLFLSDDRSEEQNEIFNYLKSLLHFRKSYKTLSSGRLIHFPPYDNLYIYFKEDEKNKFMVVINADDKNREVPLHFFSTQLEGYIELENLFNKKLLTLEDNAQFQIDALQSLIFKLN